MAFDPITACWKKLFDRQTSKHSKGLNYGTRLVNNTLVLYLDNKYYSIEAKVLLTAIGYYESRFEYRQQIGGPAKGLWQFEEIGVEEVFRNPRSTVDAGQLATSRGLSPDYRLVFDKLPEDDILACGIARLYLWTDPYPLPEVRDMHGARQCYLRVWRPGKFREDDWERDYDAACRAHYE